MTTSKDSDPQMHYRSECPCHEDHEAAEPPGMTATDADKEAWRPDVCGRCGCSLLCPTQSSGCARCLSADAEVSMIVVGNEKPTPRSYNRLRLIFGYD
jgi:hypothetical protein